MAESIQMDHEPKYRKNVHKNRTNDKLKKFKAKKM
jgi:hypothetical protein